MNIVFVNDTSTDNHFGCELVVKNINFLCQFFKINIIRSIAKDEIADLNNILEVIEKLDFKIFLINGEGSFHHDSIYCEKLLKKFKKIKEMGKDIYLINASWSSNSPDSAKNLVWAKDCFFRESLSAGEARPYFAKAKILPDITLYGGHGSVASWKDPKQHSQSSKKRFLYTDSVNIDFSLELDQIFGKKKDFELLAIRYSRPGLIKNLLFIRSFLSKKTVKNLKKLCRTLAYALKYKNRVPNDLMDFIGKIDSADLVITARFHVMTCCILRGTPFIAVLPYKNSIYTDSNKIRGLVSDLNLNSLRVVTLDELKRRTEIDNYEWSCNELMALRVAKTSLQRGWEDVFKKIKGESNE